MGEEPQAFTQNSCLVLVHLYGASLYQLLAVRVVLHFGKVEFLTPWIAVGDHFLGSVTWARQHNDKGERECQEPLSHQNSLEEI